MKKNDITRRELIGAGGAIAAAAAMGSSANAKATKLMTIPEGISQTNVSLIASAYGRIGRNAMDYAMSPDIKPLVDIGKTIIGPAVTTKWEPGKLDDPEDVNKYVYDPLDEAPSGSIWIVESGTDKTYSMFGDIIVQACARNGMLGAVTDSGCRDIVEMEKHGFGVFAKSTVPYGPQDITPTAANVPVTCGGVSINPGDLIAADIDGVMVIPKELINDLEEAVAVYLEYEGEVRKKVEAGETLRSAYPY